MFRAAVPQSAFSCSPHTCCPQRHFPRACGPGEQRLLRGEAGGKWPHPLLGLSPLLHPGPRGGWGCPAASLAIPPAQCKEQVRPGRGPILLLPLVPFSPVAGKKASGLGVPLQQSGSVVTGDRALCCPLLLLLRQRKGWGSGVIQADKCTGATLDRPHVCCVSLGCSLTSLNLDFFLQRMGLKIGGLTFREYTVPP